MDVTKDDIANFNDRLTYKLIIEEGKKIMEFMKRITDPNNRIFALAREGERLPNIFLLLVAFVLIFVVSVFCFVVVFISIPSEWKKAIGQEEIFSLFILFPIFFYLISVWIRSYEKRSIETLGFVKEGRFWSYVRGFLFGTGTMALTVTLMMISGVISIHGGLLPQGIISISGIFLLLLGFIVQGGTEEVLTRGWILPVVGARYKPWIGIAVSTLLFSLLHLGNMGINILSIINLALVGFFLAFYCLHEGNIWGVCGWHSAWNWTQGNLFGLEVSGVDPIGGSLIDLESAGPQFLSGGEFGPEGSVMTTIALIIAIAVIPLIKNSNNLTLSD